LALNGQISQAGRALAALAPNSFGVQSSNDGELANARTIWRLGQRPNIPAPLWLSQATEEQGDPLMMELKVEIVAGLTDTTLTRVNR
jgi:hypothetical protein